MSNIDLRDFVPAGIVLDQSSQDVLQNLSVNAQGAADPATATGGSSAQDVTEQIAQLNEQVTSLNSTQQGQTGATQDNTAAITQNTASQSGGTGSSVGGTIGDVASSLLGGSLTLSPIISGLVSLFTGGGDSSTPAPLTRFQLPTAVQYQAGVTGGGQVTSADYASNGLERAQPPSAPTQINIQVNALDSQSFMDHSDDIANAVRQAMLSSNSLNDVIADL